MPRASARHPFEGDWSDWRDVGRQSPQIEPIRGKTPRSHFSSDHQLKPLLLESFSARCCLTSASIACHV
jgi:hypothetical protein